jgi:hypothetical protein
MTPSLTVPNGRFTTPSLTVPATRFIAGEPMNQPRTDMTGYRMSPLRVAPAYRARTWSGVIAGMTIASFLPGGLHRDSMACLKAMWMWSWCAPSVK